MVVDASILQPVSLSHVVVTILSVWQEHTATVCEAHTTIAVDTMHIRFGVVIFPFAAVVPVLLCSFFASKSIIATGCADLSSQISW